ncbi:MAG: hypothetical protein SH818_18380, partial [Saprospiraceae bacterium]|nr:hypothetical protein [Saprospiraceae bacterium]
AFTFCQSHPPIGRIQFLADRRLKSFQYQLMMTQVLYLDARFLCAMAIYTCICIPNLGTYLYNLQAFIGYSADPIYSLLLTFA